MTYKQRKQVVRSMIFYYFKSIFTYPFNARKIKGFCGLINEYTYYSDGIPATFPEFLVFKPKVIRPDSYWFGFELKDIFKRLWICIKVYFIMSPDSIPPMMKYLILQNAHTNIKGYGNYLSRNEIITGSLLRYYNYDVVHIPTLLPEITIAIWEAKKQKDYLELSQKEKDLLIVDMAINKVHINILVLS